jgi:uncharacterized protein (DUF4213/DUF364 family)
VKCWQRVARAFMAEFGSALRSWSSLRISRYIVGIRYTYVELEGGWCGVAATPYWLGVERLEFVGLKAPQPTPNTIARLAFETGNPLAFSLLIASANAATSALIASQPTPWLERSNIVSLLRSLEARRVVMVGFMEGLARKLRSEGFEVNVIEADRFLAGRARLAGFNLLGGVEALRAIEDADAVIVSGSALTDPCKAMEVVETARGSVILVGPSASFHPRIACRLGVGWLAGVYYDRRICWALHEVVSQGGGPHTAERVWGVRLPEWLARASC